MHIRITEQNGIPIAVVETGETRIHNAQTALDLMATVHYDSGCGHMVLNKSAFDEAFFVLSSGFAGEVLQKFSNYRMKLAIVGDYSVYTSKPLHDFIYESNNGRDIFFVATMEEALERLSRV